MLHNKSQHGVENHHVTNNYDMFYFTHGIVPNGFEMSQDDAVLTDTGVT